MATHGDEVKIQNGQEADGVKAKLKRRLTALTLLFALAAAAAGSAFFFMVAARRRNGRRLCCRTRGSGYAAKGRHGAEGFARRYGCREKGRRAGGVGRR